MEMRAASNDKSAAWIKEQIAEERHETRANSNSSQQHLNRLITNSVLQKSRVDAVSSNAVDTKRRDFEFS